LICAWSAYLHTGRGMWQSRTLRPDT
jgi:hypothetical protein